MKKLKSMLITLSMLIALCGIFAPMQVVRADNGDPQGTTDSQRKSTTTTDQTAMALLLWLMRLLGV